MASIGAFARLQACSLSPSSPHVVAPLLAAGLDTVVSGTGHCVVDGVEARIAYARLRIDRD